jgi:hypothetical protein
MMCVVDWNMAVECWMPHEEGSSPPGKSENAEGMGVNQ